MSKKQAYRYSGVLAQPRHNAEPNVWLYRLSVLSIDCGVEYQGDSSCPAPLSWMRKMIVALAKRHEPSLISGGHLQRIPFNDLEAVSKVFSQLVNGYVPGLRAARQNPGRPSRWSNSNKFILMARVLEVRANNPGTTIGDAIKGVIKNYPSEYLKTGSTDELLSASTLQQIYESFAAQLTKSANRTSFHSPEQAKVAVLYPELERLYQVVDNLSTLQSARIVGSLLDGAPESDGLRQYCDSLNFDISD